MLGKGYVALPDSTLTSSETLGFTPNKVSNNFDECFASISDVQIENSQVNYSILFRRNSMHKTEDIPS